MSTSGDAASAGIAPSPGHRDRPRSAGGSQLSRRAVSVPGQGPFQLAGGPRGKSCERRYSVTCISFRTPCIVDACLPIARDHRMAARLYGSVRRVRVRFTTTAGENPSLWLEHVDPLHCSSWQLSSLASFWPTTPNFTPATHPTIPLPPDAPPSLASSAGGEPGLPSIAPRTSDTVAAANQRPPKPVVSDQTAIAGRTFTYTVPEVTDPDGDTLDYNAFHGLKHGSSSSYEWLSFDTGTRTFTGNPRDEHEKATTRSGSTCPTGPSKAGPSSRSRWRSTRTRRRWLPTTPQRSPRAAR